MKEIRERNIKIQIASKLMMFVLWELKFNDIMKKLTIISLFFILSISKSYTQNIDSLWTVWKKETYPDSMRLEALDIIIWNYYLFSQPDSAYYLAQVQHDFAYKKKLKPFVAKALDIQGIAKSMLGDQELAILKFEKSILISKELNDDNGVYKSMANVANVYSDQGNYTKAIDLNMQCLKFYEKENNLEDISMCLSNLAFLYSSQGENKTAIDYINKSIDIDKKENNIQSLTISIYNRGNIYLEIAEEFEKNNDIVKANEYYQMALSSYKQSLVLSNNTNNINGKVYSLIGIASITNINGDLDSSLFYYNKALYLNSNIDNQLNNAIILNGIGGIYLDKNNISKAEENCHKAYIIAKESGLAIQLKSSAKSLYQIYKQKKEYNKALLMHEILMNMNDSLQNEENQKEVIKQKLNYDYEKQKLIDDLENSKKIQIEKAKQKQQFIVLVIVIISTALILILLLIIYRRLQLTKKQKLIIEEQKKIVDEVNEELNQTNEEILAQRDQIEQQKHKIEHAHNEVKASINYAERIQKALLDNKEHWDSISEHFILFRPRDIVSGDFYWSYSNDKIAIWAAADCTGHGVPGAFMSMLGVSFLNEIVADGGETNPGRILDKLRAKIIKALEQKSSEDERKDGMDIALCVWNKSTNILQFAGANNPLILIRHSEGGMTEESHLYDDIIEIKPDKMPIGSHILDKNAFTTHEIQLQKGDTIYTFTDGFQDQFGGPEEKKYMVKRLKQYLAGLNETPISQQKALLNHEFEQWLQVGKAEQIDDVCVIGVKI